MRQRMAKAGVLGGLLNRSRIKCPICFSLSVVCIWFRDFARSHTTDKLKHIGHLTRSRLLKSKLLQNSLSLRTIDEFSKFACALLVLSSLDHSQALIDWPMYISGHHDPASS